MSTTTDPRRLADYGDRLNGLVRSGLDAERAAAPDASDAARLDAIGAKLAARLASPDGPDALPPRPPLPARPAWRPLLALGAAAAVAVAAFVASRTPGPARGRARRRGIGARVVQATCHGMGGGRYPWNR
ncbi:MAG: hypothetical protein JWP97_3376, partial [Labilithrix sp.]|nr:hypothetical protein [Labilithrix sp.]